VHSVHSVKVSKCVSVVCACACVLVYCNDESFISLASLLISNCSCNRE